MTGPTRSRHSERPAPRVLGGLTSFTVVAGSMLGIGIFIYPPQVAQIFTHAGPFLLVWALGGLFALSGAVAYAELGAMFPRAGGDYEFLREGFGPSISFAAGWVIFGATFTGSIATMSVALAQYQIPALLHAIPTFAGVDLRHTIVRGPFDSMLDGTRLVGVGLVIALTWLNIAGARVAGWAQGLTTLLPLVLMAGVAIWALSAGHAAPQTAIAAPSPLSRGVLSGLDAFVSAYLAVYFAYAGWNAVIYVGGEVREPGRVVPRSLISGTLTVTALYLLLCVAFLHVLGGWGLAHAGEAGSALAGVLGGSAARTIMTALIAAAIIASINATILGGARVVYAMALRGAFWSWAGRLDARRGVPRRALVLQAVWASVYILTGTFADIYTLTSLAMVLTGSLTVLTLFVLRRRRPDEPRPYRTSGYPWLPALYLLSSALVITMMLRRALTGAQGALYPLVGLGLLVSAYLVHRLVLRGSMRGTVHSLAFGLVITGLVAAPAGHAASVGATPPQDLGALRREALVHQDSPLSRSARRLNGIVTCSSEEPPYPIDGYQAYCHDIHKYLGVYRRRFRDVAGPWFAKHRPNDLPPIVLYPFSGADLVTSVLVFPNAVLHVQLSLERGGPPDALDGLSPEDRGQALKNLLFDSGRLLSFGDSRTIDLKKAQTTQLPGVLPLTLVGLAAHDATIVSLRYFRLDAAGHVVYVRPGRYGGPKELVRTGGYTATFGADFSNFELAFRLPGSKDMHILQHIAANLDDHSLHTRDGLAVQRYIEALGPVAFMTKAASYLLWDGSFSIMRNLAIRQARWMVSDSTGVLPWMLPAGQWTVTPYGHFACDFLNQRARDAMSASINNRLVAFFRAHAKQDLPFRFGYLDCRHQAHLMIANRRK